MAYTYSPSKGQITATFGPCLVQPYWPYPPGDLAPWSGGVSLIVNGDLNAQDSLEIGLANYHKLYLINLDDGPISEKTEVLHITMGYRHWLANFISVSASLYTDYPHGEVQLQHAQSNPTASTETSAHRNVNYGIDLSAQAELTRWSTSSLILDARYSRALTKKANEFADNYNMMIGLKYIIQDTTKVSQNRQEAL